VPPPSEDAPPSEERPRTVREWYEANRSYVFASAVIMSVGGVVAGYHGYKRSNGALGRTLGWAALGVLVPIIAVPVAFAQGYGKRG
jgi:hypothetical protein